MHLWRAGEIITAEKLTPRILSGDELMQFTNPVGSYFRAESVITFPAGFFRNPPMLSLAARTTVPGIFITVTYTAKSVNGFTLMAARNTDTATWVDWTAIEVPEY